MTRFEEAPVPPVFPVAAVRRVRPVRVPRRVVRPLRRQLRPAWQARQEARRRQAGPESVPIPPPEVDPPETYGEHGERFHVHGDLPPAHPNLDWEA